MKKRLFMIFVFILIQSNFSYALCSEEQIDINSADKEELDKLYGIGPVKAEAIIDSRPFEDIQDLINVYGIGEATINKIIDQGLACVNGEETDEKEKAVEEVIEDDESEVEIKENIKEVIELETINLNPINIKSENDNKLDKGNYAIYGFVLFCVLLCFLFILKRKRINKNEF